MARIRTIKPEFWQDEKLALVGPLTRLVFLGLISMADDSGRLVDNVKLLDGMLFSLTDDSCGKSLEELSTLGRIVRYRSESGQALIQIVHWDKHQKVKNPSSYTLPAPPVEPNGHHPEANSVEATPVLRRVGGESNAPTFGHDPRSPIPDLKASLPAVGKSEYRAPELPAVAIAGIPPNGQHPSEIDSRIEARRLQLAQLHATGPPGNDG